MTGVCTAASNSASRREVFRIISIFAASRGAVRNQERVVRVAWTYHDARLHVERFCLVSAALLVRLVNICSLMVPCASMLSFAHLGFPQPHTIRIQALLPFQRDCISSHRNSRTAEPSLAPTYEEAHVPSSSETSRLQSPYAG